MMRAGFKASFNGLFNPQAFGGELRDGRLKFAADLRRGRRLLRRVIGCDAGELFMHGDAPARGAAERERDQKDEDTNTHR